MLPQPRLSGRRALPAALASALLILAVAAPATLATQVAEPPVRPGGAQARDGHPEGPRHAHRHAHRHVRAVAPAAPASPAGGQSLSAADGFDWGDAAIGAGSILGLVLLIAGGGVAATRRRSERRALPTATS